MAKIDRWNSSFEKLGSVLNSIQGSETPNVNTPTLCLDDNIDWQMSRWEKYSLYNIVSLIKPKFAIEIGTYKGGSLDIISKYCDNIYSIDVDCSVKEKLSEKYSNVVFLNGKSLDMLPAALCNVEKTGINFILGNCSPGQADSGVLA